MARKPTPNTTNANTVTDPTVLAANLSGALFTPEQRAFRDAFAKAYIVDFCGHKAMSRCGATSDAKKPEVALEAHARRLLTEPYVARKVKEALDEVKETDIVSRNQVLQRLWAEANDLAGNSGKERITALTVLAKVLGMTKESKVDATEAPQTVMLVPVVASGDWEAAAAAAQQELKARAVSPAPAPLPAPFVHGQS